MVGAGVDGEQVQRVGGDLVASVGVEILGALLPGVGKRNYMVNLEAVRDLGLASEDEMRAGVGLVELSGEDGALVGVEDGGGAELTLEDALAETAAFDFWPAGVELVAAIAGLGRTTFDG